MGMLIVIFCAIALLSTAKSQTEDDFLSKLTGRVQFGIKLASQLFGFDPSKGLLNNLSFTLQKLGKNGGSRGIKVRRTFLIQDFCQIKFLFNSLKFYFFV